MEMTITIKVDKKTKEIIENFIRFCYNNNIDEVRDIGELAATIGDGYVATAINDQIVYITYE